MSDPYTVLGVTRDTPLADIKKAYKKLAMQYHPDRNAGNDVKFKEVQAAYEKVKDGPPAADAFTSFSFNTDQGFEELLKRHRRRSIGVSLKIPLKVAINGGPFIVRMQVGTSVEAYKIDIPPGIMTHERISYPGLVPDHDVIITFLIEKDPGWEVDNLNLIKAVDISIWDLILGTEIDVITIDDVKIRLKIPPRTQPNTFMRVRGKGIRLKQTHRVGDMLVRLDAKIPKDIPANMLALIKEIKG